MTTEKNSEREHGKGHVTATIVPCKLQQWDRYRVPENVFLFLIVSWFWTQLLSRHKCSRPRPRLWCSRPRPRPRLWKTSLQLM